MANFRTLIPESRDISLNPTFMLVGAVVVTGLLLKARIKASARKFLTVPASIWLELIRKSPTVWGSFRMVSSSYAVSRVQVTPSSVQ